MNRTRKNKPNKSKEYTYRSDDFTSKDGMLTTIWGPGMWHFLHTMSFNYPDQPSKDEMQHYKDFFISLKYVWANVLLDIPFYSSAIICIP